MMSTKLKQSAKKGIYKPKEFGKSTSKPKVSEGGESSGRELLSFPMLKTTDNDRILPRYSTILNRSEDDGVGMEDLDALQLELESLLSTVVVRSRMLQEEIQALSNAEEKRDKKSKITPSKPPLSPGKRAKQSDKPMKKLKKKLSKVRGESSPVPTPVKPTKLKGVLPTTLSEHGSPDHSKLEPPKLFPPKNDTPNRFWLSVEPYCADIQPDDLKLLDELVHEHNNDAEYQRIPSLGRHYSLRWAQEDLQEEQDAASSMAKGKSHPGEPSNLLRKLDKPPETTGPLTQRLISALMEENIMVPMQEVCEGKRSRSGGENASPPRQFRNYAASFERRVRRELEEQGILDPSDQAKEPADDEILAEMKRCQAELRVVSQHNLQQLKRLRKLATDEMERQQLKRRLQHVDIDIIDIYRRIQSNKLKKKPTLKKEQEQAIKALKDREALVKQIDSM